MYLNVSWRIAPTGSALPWRRRSARLKILRSASSTRTWTSSLASNACVMIWVEVWMSSRRTAMSRTMWAYEMRWAAIDACSTRRASAAGPPTNSSWSERRSSSCSVSTSTGWPRLKSRGMRNGALLADDADPELGGDVVVEPHGDGELAQRLDRLVEHDSPPLDLDAVLVQKLRHVLRGDGPEELALLGRLTTILVHERVDARAQRLGVRLDAARLGVLLLVYVLEVFRFTARAAQPTLLPDHVVA